MLADYAKARDAYLSLQEDPAKLRYRDNYLKILKSFDRFVKRMPKDPKAPDALYNAGQLSWSLYLVSRVPGDLRRASGYFERLSRAYPRSSLADDGLYLQGKLLVEHGGDKTTAYRYFQRLLSDFPHGDMRSKAKASLTALAAFKPKSRTKASPARRAKISASKRSGSSSALATQSAWQGVAGGAPIHLGTLRSDTKLGSGLMLPLAGALQFREGQLPGDPKKGEAKRYYIDLKPAILNPEAAVNSLAGQNQGLATRVGLRRVRVAQFNPTTVRIVLDLGQDQQPATQFRQDPRRLEIQLSGPRAPASPASAASAAQEVASLRALQKKIAAGPAIPLAVQAGLKIHRVVIDAGHGGKDYGAVGHGGTREKDVVLAIAKRLGPKLAALGLDVIYTRKKDRYVSLADRTQRANAKQADLFISIHANAHPHRDLRGVSTYTLDIASDRYSVRLASLENASGEQSVSGLGLLLAELAKHSNVDESKSLARSVQNSCVQRLEKNWNHVRNLGVKSALFYVLLGAHMPSILVETSFLSNPTEEKRLKSKRYQEALADGIAKGVSTYLRDRERLVLGPF